MIAFLLGAGFNVDANRYAAEGHLCRHPKCEYDWCPDQECDRPRYPLVPGLLQSCFALDRLPDNKSVEDLFADASTTDNQEPLKRLAEILARAESFIPGSLIGSTNPYTKFLERFKESPLMTLNYDLLLEQILFSLRRWHPEDGFGVPARVTRRWSRNPVDKFKTSQKVLHLHGCLWLHSDDFEIIDRVLVARETPVFEFDAPTPSSLPFSHRAGEVNYEDRIVPPVPDKRKLLGPVGWAREPPVRPLRNPTHLFVSGIVSAHMTKSPTALCSGH